MKVTTALSEFYFGGTLGSDLAVYVTGPDVYPLLWKTEYTGYFEEELTTEPLPEDATF